jgi:hypothetical protein
MECKDIVFSGHAVRRMFERGINEIDLSEVIAEGELIDEYLDDKPFPSVLLLGRANDQAIHVVLGVNAETGVCYVITVYLPDPGLWLAGFRKRRSP